MKIKVERIENAKEIFDLDVELHWTIKWLKTLLSEKTEEPIALQHLFFDGKELDDHLDIQSCRLPNNAHLYLCADPDSRCAMVSRMDNLLFVLRDISKAKLFKKI